MAAAIWKFPLNPYPARLQMPIGARVLAADLQRGDLQLWALVDPSAPTETRHFDVYGTGHEVEDPERLTFIDTVQAMGGDLVLHVFERSPR